ncbi:Crp/Fnr family transcriptional regulator [Lacinutrix mariniflava]|uniref:Crp/Fnr family transcriptional regulator n=1 Tax=Lacinutrix mariniflava TaxID=342955 RepID=UPI0006E2CE8D|nr:Crp/Fnr family transcriptional regulator [Lacinutrix mariniflava]
MKPYYKEAFDFINTFQPVPKPVYDTLYKIASYKEIKQGEKLLDLGVVPQKIYFIASGVIRSYILLTSGKEVTTALYNPLMFFASFRALLKKEPTNLIFEALTDCHVFEIDFGVFYNLCKKDINLMTLYSKFLGYLILRSEARFIEMSSNDAKERYLLLRERIPNLDNTIAQYQIASSLGITPVQLSRIRAKL